MNNSTTGIIMLKPMMEKIIMAACNYFSIDESELINSQSWNVVYYKKLCMYLIKEHVIISNYKIANRLGLKNHSTVSKHIDDIGAQKNIYAPIKNDLQKIMEITNNLDVQFTTYGMVSK